MFKLIERITRDAKVCSGKPCIQGTRIPVQIILDLLAVSEGFDRIKTAYPNLTDEDIRACMSYSYIETAKNVFEKSKYKAIEEDIKRLATNMVLLEKRGLDELNKRLITARNNQVWDTIAEHNFAVMLVSQQSPTTVIDYELPAPGRRPDFRVKIGNITYVVQVKNLARLARENIQGKIMGEIKRLASEIKIGKYLGCTLSDHFNKDCLPELLSFIKDKAGSAGEGENYLFEDKNNQKAEIMFWSPQMTVLSELTLVCEGDIEILEITDLSKDQIIQSLQNAARAFNPKSDEQTINLIAMEADNKYDLDICDALFGKEYEKSYSNGSSGWDRKADGFFGNQNFPEKVAGVIAMKRKSERVEEIMPLSPEEKEISCDMSPEEIKEALKWKTPGPIADYSLILYVNDAFKHRLEDIKKLIHFDKIVYYNERPHMGNGNFEI